MNVNHHIAAARKTGGEIRRLTEEASSLSGTLIHAKAWPAPWLKDGGEVHRDASGRFSSGSGADRSRSTNPSINPIKYEKAAEALVALKSAGKTMEEAHRQLLPKVRDSLKSDAQEQMRRVESFFNEKELVKSGIRPREAKAIMQSVNRANDAIADGKYRKAAHEIEKAYGESEKATLISEAASYDESAQLPGDADENERRGVRKMWEAGALIKGGLLSIGLGGLALAAGTAVGAPAATGVAGTIIGVLVALDGLSSTIGGAIEVGVGLHSSTQGTKLLNKSKSFFRRSLTTLGKAIEDRNPNDRTTKKYARQLLSKMDEIDREKTMRKASS